MNMPVRLLAAVPEGLASQYSIFIFNIQNVILNLNTPVRLLQVSLEDLQVESLVPEELRRVATVDEYMARLPDFDDEMAAIADGAEASGNVIRYIGLVDVANKSCSVKLIQYPKDHPFAQLSGSDNMVVFTSKRYNTRPLIVRGPGAGAEVTAMGVFNDFVQVLKHTGAPSL